MATHRCNQYKMERKYEESKGGEADFIASKQRRYYTPSEVSMHNSVYDCWVSLFGKVFDLTSLLREASENEKDLTLPLIRRAGEDVSDWFDEETNDLKYSIDKATGLRVPELPHGRFLHVAPLEPVSDWKTDFDEPWWRDGATYCVGCLSSSVRKIIIRNMLTYQETELEVCEEETLEEVQDRYVDWNSHASSYTWKALDGDTFRPLDMSRTLTENGVLDETPELKKLSIPVESFIPTIHVYFNDDLTEA